MQRDSDQTVLKAIEENGMIFVSAQPDTTYFHWQVEIYLYQFAKHGILNKCYALFGYKNSPSDYAKNLAKKYPNIKFYRDDRIYTEYSPTIRPHILAKFFRDYPHLGKNVFYHDSDIFIVKLPRFDLMLQQFDSNAYVSDTKSYIGYDYIKECSNRYKTKYPQLKDQDIFYGMCDSINIDPNLIQKNQQNSGGAQYLLKNINHTFWEKCEKGCQKMYDYLCDYEKKYPISNHIQKWTTDMWVVLWFYWRDIGTAVIHKELEFSWATGTVKDYNTMNIFHLAGITGTNSSDKFHKGLYTKQIIFDAYFNNPRLFDHINKDNGTFEYAKVLKEYTKSVYMPERHLIKAEITEGIFDTNNNKSIVRTINYKDPRPIDQIIGNNHNRGNQRQVNQRQINQRQVNQQFNVVNTNVQRFRIKSTGAYNGVYNLFTDKMCCGKNIWRSYDRRHIIFWTGKHWILTFSRYEDQIGPACGGIISNGSDMPYMRGWNVGNVTCETF